MNSTMEHDDITKSETIAAIHRLAPSSQRGFLDNFSEQQLQSFLERLEEVETVRHHAYPPTPRPQPKPLSCAERENPVTSLPAATPFYASPAAP
jgi:hypothetical protein